MAAHRILRGLIAAVWLVNGLFCKVLGRSPRHRAIVARILGNTHADTITKLIGGAEISMTLWIASGIASRFNALTQMAVVAAMNIIEFIFAPDLLLWGKLNSVFASGFIFAIYYDEFILGPRLARSHHKHGVPCSPTPSSHERGSHT